MTSIEKLVEQHVLEYESRLKHVDELLERAHKATEKEPPAVSEELAALKKERERFAAHLEELRLKSLQDWREEEIEKAGPMGIWDALAQQVENFVERLE